MLQLDAEEAPMLEVAVGGDANAGAGGNAGIGRGR